MAHYLKIIFFCLLGGTTMMACANDVVMDPTQPPAGINAPSTGVVPSNASPVQIIMVRGKHCSAMVRGKMVEVGDRIEEGRILRITDHDLWVKADGQMNTMKLYPNVSKRFVVAPITSSHHHSDW